MTYTQHPLKDVNMPAPMDGMNDMAPPMEDAGPADLSQGYCIKVDVLPDGSFKVSGPEPLEAEGAEETGEPGSELGEDYEDIAGALKGVLKIIKGNPVGGDGNAAFNAGYSA